MVTNQTEKGRDTMVGSGTVVVENESDNIIEE